MTHPDTRDTKPSHHRLFFGAAIALVRNTWRKLTSMRTALVLLFLLALAAVPAHSYLNETSTWAKSMPT